MNGDQEDRHGAAGAGGGRGAPAGESEGERSDAVAGRRRSDPGSRRAKRPWWVELPILVVVAFALTFVIQTFVAKVYYVPSGSMEETIHGVPRGGDRILASKIVYDFRDPRQGDVVVFKGPDAWAVEADVPGPSTWYGKALSAVGSVVGVAPANEKDFVKRVIAVGGQTVACCDAQGNVTVDGTPLHEPYIFQPLPFQPGVADCQVGGADPDHYGSRRCFAAVKIPAGQLWVMGDHRSYSDDSSYNCLQLKPAAAPPSCGRPIPVADVIGEAIFIVAPISRWHTIGELIMPQG